MLSFSCTLASAAFFLQCALFSYIPLHAYAPWIALSILRSPLLKDKWKPLWLSAAAGTFVDLFSGHPLGFHALCYSLASFLLFPLRNRFLYDKPLHFALFTSLLSCVFSLFQIFFLFLFDRSGGIPGEWGIADRLTMALFDGIYAVGWFSGPLFLWIKARRAWVVFWLKKKRSPISP